MQALVNNGYTNFTVLATHGDFVWCARCNDPRPYKNDGPLTMRASDLVDGHLKIKLLEKKS